jgi:hypothetical protein
LSVDETAVIFHSLLPASLPHDLAKPMEKDVLQGAYPEPGIMSRQTVAQV